MVVTQHSQVRDTFAPFFHGNTQDMIAVKCNLTANREIRFTIALLIIGNNLDIDYYSTVVSLCLAVITNIVSNSNGGAGRGAA